MTDRMLVQLQADERYQDLSRRELLELAGVVDRLRQVSLFDSLPDKDLIQIAEQGHLRHYVSGDIIIREGDTDKVFYVVLRGQVRVWTEEAGKRRLLNYHRTGDFFGEMCFQDGGRRTANVDVVDDVDLVAFERAGYERIIEHRQIAEYLETWGQERIRRSNAPFPGKQWDEISVVHARKSWVALALELALPLGSILLVLVVWYALDRLTDASGQCTTSAFIAFAVAMGLWIFAMWEDWRNDDFIVTSKRIIHIERVFIPPFPLERHEAPIAQVTDITALGYWLLTRLFGVQKLAINTAGAGTIEFPYLQDADEIREQIFRARQLATAQRNTTERTRIRQELARVLDQPTQEEITPIEDSEQTQVTPERKGLAKLLHYFVPYGRTVLADRIVWRRHWLTLVAAVLLPMLAIAFALFLLILGLARPGILEDLPAWFALGLPAAFLASSFVWYVWRYDGWRNDYYVVTDSRIIDVEGSPFHLREEKIVEGTFDIIQNTYYTSQGWVARIFRIGDVIIDTAAQRAAFTFHDVARPEQVQQQIFERLSAFREKRSEEAAERRYAEFARWFDTYHRSVIEQKE
jgi:uncharacterized membrane protein YdbT with pleckstrin-like domain